MRSPSTGTGRKEKTGEDTGRCAGRSGGSGLEKHLSEKQEGDAGQRGRVEMGDAWEEYEIDALHHEREQPREAQEGSPAVLIRARSAQYIY